ncbi:MULTISPECIES: SRPBCC family protein [unclassified Dysgonomonas]|jgi:carbon monoxide dehydrogenase subunit G|uniref:SRPBCC family protein n=1 Tax=unclassified Dysgonomonas TaxID=2630389 RepID=UPI0025C1C159|nr:MULTISPECIES: SRPBCC family protein [unclassified Dysgonomonas]MDR2004451.1 SRPBCC family protein [Prevotella sp.]HMM03063.1 SRPBCC family protein [Dysgonomonas sp.]
MTEFVSEIKTIPHSDVDVYTVLSDLNNLELAKNIIPQDKVKDFTFDTDSCTVSVDPVGKIRFVVVEREPNKTIKFQAEQLPFGVTMWIQLVPTNGAETKMKLTIKADLNPFLKPMVSKPLQAGLDKVAEGLAGLPYNHILNKGTIE